MMTILSTGWDLGPDEPEPPGPFGTHTNYREAIVRLMRDVLDATDYEIEVVLKEQGYRDRTLEHFTADIDLVQHDDGTWRADKYSREGPIIKTSRLDSYPSRAALLFALRHDSDFWIDAYSRPGSSDG